MQQQQLRCIRGYCNMELNPCRCFVSSKSISNNNIWDRYSYIKTIWKNSNENFCFFFITGCQAPAGLICTSVITNIITMSQGRPFRTFKDPTTREKWIEPARPSISPRLISLSWQWGSSETARGRTQQTMQWIMRSSQGAALKLGDTCTLHSPFNVSKRLHVRLSL